MDETTDNFVRSVTFCGVVCTNDDVLYMCAARYRTARLGKARHIKAKQGRIGAVSKCRVS